MISSSVIIFHRGYSRILNWAHWRRLWSEGFLSPWVTAHDFYFRIFHFSKSLEKNKLAKVLTCSKKHFIIQQIVIDIRHCIILKSEDMAKDSKSDENLLSVIKITIICGDLLSFAFEELLRKLISLFLFFLSLATNLRISSIWILESERKKKL